MLKNPKLINLLPDDIFKALLTTAVMNPDETYKAKKQTTALDKTIAQLIERKKRGKLSKKQKQDLMDAEREKKRRKEKRKKKGLNNHEIDDIRKKVLKSDADPAKEGKRIKKLVSLHSIHAKNTIFGLFRNFKILKSNSSRTSKF